jgi:hypothetical protein
VGFSFCKHSDGGIAMKVIEYVAEILPDGHLSLPAEVREQLNLSAHRHIKVTLMLETPQRPTEEQGW